jgi:hypothetical protein
MPRLEWQAPSIPTPERTVRWYLIGSAVLVLGLVYCIFAANWSFALALLVIAATYALLRKSKPVFHRIRIENGGFLFDDAFVGWEDCTDFWFVVLPSYTELHFEKKRGANRNIKIQTGPTDPAQIRAVLGEFLPERSDQRESLSETIIRILKL